MEDHERAADAAQNRAARAPTQRHYARAPQHDADAGPEVRAEADRAFIRALAERLFADIERSRAEGGTTD